MDSEMSINDILKMVAMSPDLCKVTRHRKYSMIKLTHESRNLYVYANTKNLCRMHIDVPGGTREIAHGKDPKLAGHIRLLAERIGHGSD